MVTVGWMIDREIILRFEEDSGNGRTRKERDRRSVRLGQER